MCVETLRTGLIFPKTDQFEGHHMPRFSSKTKMNVFPSMSLETHKCVLKPQNRAHFSKMIDLRGHMPRFSLKKNVFPSISLKTP